MRNWKNWLFPILTCLTVAALALLPLRLSTLRDGELTGTVHAEPLSEDSNFPFKPPDLPGRIWLLVQWAEMPDSLSIMSQELEGADRDREIRRLREALTALEDILPPDMAAVLAELDGDFWSWDRYYLRDQTDLSSASVTVTSTYDKRAALSLSAILDGESGQILELQVTGETGAAYDASPETGRAFLDRLLLDYEAINELSSEAVYGLAAFRLTECNCWFWVRQFDHSLSFQFEVDWAAVDAALSESYGYATDAGSMQIW